MTCASLSILIACRGRRARGVHWSHTAWRRVLELLVFRASSTFDRSRRPDIRAGRGRRRAHRRIAATDERTDLLHQEPGDLRRDTRLERDHRGHRRAPVMQAQARVDPGDVRGSIRRPVCTAERVRPDRSERSDRRDGCGRIPGCAWRRRAIRPEWSGWSRRSGGRRWDDRKRRTYGSNGCNWCRRCNRADWRFRRDRRYWRERDYGSDGKHRRDRIDRSLRGDRRHRSGWSDRRHRPDRRDGFVRGRRTDGRYGSDRPDGSDGRDWFDWRHGRYRPDRTHGSNG